LMIGETPINVVCLYGIYMTSNQFIMTQRG
jgi:hypothetical protein